MALIVQKYGGTSVGDVERIQRVAEKVLKTRQKGHDVVVVVSAMSGETNRLVALAKSIADPPNPREYDVVVATGEQVTIGLLAIALNVKNCPARSYTGGQVPIRTDSAHTKARIMDIDERRIRQDLQVGRVVVVAGFQGVDEEGNITTLGRGGSDTTAVALAAALKADECQIYTDVDGVYSTDPRIVPEARLMERVTFDEMLELASLGAKVLQIRAVEFASKYKVPLRVLSSFKEGPGTLITAEEENMEQPTISGIAFNRDEAQLTVMGVPDQPGTAYRILAAIGDENIEVDMIIQDSAIDTASTNLTFTVHRNEYDKAFKILEGLNQSLQFRNIRGNKKIVKISLVGVGLRSHASIAAKMFKALADEGINIRMISTSEIKISVVVDEKYTELAVRTLHSTFDLQGDSD
jgi:aspartate kinase